MIDGLLAKRIIERISKCIDYNVNIMDEKGIIIASRNASRIGTYHEIALQIIRGDEDTIIVDNEITQFGVKQGVNMAIYYKKRKEGVIGITGKPEEVMPIAMVIKMSVEVMLEYELYRQDRLQRRNLKEQFLNLVLYSDKIEQEDWQRFTEPLKLDESIIRIPILITIEDMTDAYENIINAIRNGSNHFTQDLICLTREKDILLYKAVDEKKENLLQSYKYIVAESISEALRYMRTANYSYKVYVGSFQSDFRYYRSGYEHCMWLKKNKQNVQSGYFYDYASEYFMSTIPLTELQVVYDTIERNVGEKFIESFKEIVEALRRANFNLNEASSMMHIHRNTLVYRLDKVRETLNADPIGDNSDREFISGFYTYLKRKEKIYTQ